MDHILRYWSLLFLIKVIMSRQLIKRINGVFPSFKQHGKKGDNGRIAVIGGSFQFTGAPFYSAISALKVGADLAHIFCSKSSAPAIKSYSPEIITHPIFVSDEEISLGQREVKKMTEGWLQKIHTWNKAINCWVIGPGLGRDNYMQTFFPLLICNLPQNSIVVLDADAIFYLTQHPQLLDELRKHRSILTPNWKELNLLRPFIDIDPEAIFQTQNNKSNSQEEIVQIDVNNSKMGFNLFIKGYHDLIIGKKSFIVRTKGGLKRCGGLGDILAGATAACSFWDFDYGAVLASRLVRRATYQAFKKEGRGLTAPCVVRQISGAVSKLNNQS